MPDERRAEDLAIAGAFGERVRAVRLELGLTQEALAEGSDLHPTFISNLERGYRVPTLPTILRVCRGLGVSVAELLGELQ